jgi:HD superfamily phosphohydrolase
MTKKRVGSEAQLDISEHTGDNAEERGGTGDTVRTLAKVQNSERPRPANDRTATDALSALLKPQQGDADISKAERQEFFLPVSGFVWLLDEEVAVVDHPAFQRLARIYQLGQAYVVYRGATHKRLEHVLGAVHIVQRMISAVDRNSKKKDGDRADRAPSLTATEQRFVRLGALLHDIGHLAAGHTVEDELNLIPKHDGDERLDLIFDGKLWADQKNRTLGQLIDEKYNRYVPSDIAEAGITATELLRLIIRKEPDHAKVEDPHKTHYDYLRQSASVRLQVCRDMVGDTICADLLDYIYRDWYHVGKPRTFDDRLLQYMEIRRGAANCVTGASDCNDHFVISLGRRPKIRTDAVSNILELLEWRYQLAEAVLFHRTKLSATAMLDRALYELWGQAGDQKKIVDFLLPLSDEEMLSKCREQAEEIHRNEKASAQAREGAQIAADLIRGLERRQLYDHLSTRFYSDLPGDVLARVKKFYGKDPDSPSSPATNRNVLLRMLELDFGLPIGSLAMYCPAGVNQKIAQVKIAVSGEIKTFSEYEHEHHEQLAGGHLDAQLKRFDRLWRIHFFIHPKVKNELGERLYLLQQAIEKLGLGHLVDEEDYQHVGSSIARSLVQVEGCPWHGKQAYSSVDAARDSGASPGSYPLGAPSIRSYISPA